ncbi:hypothetical protein MLD38_008778 [Melastoma candidum]|uniref:Uncharacterized protein n=1 Tax=Melastoma candidum TaxID=119954 RepID=A0ACB9RVD9_9MYRT|nr:hypothetical protein MLD38_008778 [Melastoma candidum]
MGGATPCASCKLLRRRCAKDCVFAPYFPPDDPHRFAIVHKVFGASNISKMLQEIPVHQRADAVSSLVYEANARVRDPVYGCVQQDPVVLPSSSQFVDGPVGVRGRQIFPPAQPPVLQFPANPGYVTHESLKRRASLVMTWFPNQTEMFIAVVVSSLISVTFPSAIHLSLLSIISPNDL